MSLKTNNVKREVKYTSRRRRKPGGSGKNACLRARGTVAG
jgi:hypothetical protein